MVKVKERVSIIIMIVSMWPYVTFRSKWGTNWQISQRGHSKSIEKRKITLTGLEESGFPYWEVKHKNRNMTHSTQFPVSYYHIICV